MSSKELIKALNEADKEKEIKQSLDLLDKFNTPYIMGENKNGTFYCGYIGDSIYECDLIMSDIDRKSYKTWIGKDIHEAVIKAVISWWAMRHVQGKEVE